MAAGLIDAIDNPDGEASSKLDAALEKKTGEDVKGAARAIMNKRERRQ